MRSARYVLTLALGAIAVQGAAAQEQTPDKVLQGIFADWRQRQGLFKTARYVIAGATEYKDASVPDGNPIRARRSTLLLDFERKRYRLETTQDILSEEGGRGLKYRVRVSTSTFDGKASHGFTHKRTNGIEGIDDQNLADLIIGKGEYVGTEFDNHLYPILFAHGLVPTVHTDIQMQKLPPAYSAEDFDVRGRQALEGRECTVVRTEPTGGTKTPIYDEFWLDATQGSAIWRHVSFNGTNPWTRMDITWTKRPFGWWPQDWTIAWSVNHKLRRVHRLQIQTFQPNPEVADSDFALEAKPGMRVDVQDMPPRGTGLDPRYPARKTYLVSATGSWEEISATGFRTIDGRTLAPQRGWSWIYAAITGAIALGAVGYLVWRKRSTRAKS
jgi:hypothetical protein